MLYVVSYDIPSNKRRLKVAKALLDFGSRVQYSVFECNLGAEHLEKMTKRLSGIISEKEDSLRIYALCGQCRGVIKVLGSGEVAKDQDVYIL